MTEASPLSSFKAERKIRSLTNRIEAMDREIEAIDSGIKIAEIRNHALNDFYFFCEKILGFDKLYLPLHGEICMALEAEDIIRLLVLIPRGHFKTTLISICLPLWCLCRNPSTRFALISVSADKAEENLQDIRARARSEEFQKYFGSTIGVENSWVTVGKGAIRIPRPPGVTGPSIAAYGVDSKEVGRHFDIMALDDIVDQEKVNSPAIRNSMWRWFGRQMSVLDPGTKLLVLGCLTADSKVLMADGSWRPIVDVKVGEKVFSLEKETQKSPMGWGCKDRPDAWKGGSWKKVPDCSKDWEVRHLRKRTVEAVIPQGKAKVLLVETNRHSLKATRNHPFLVLAGTKTEWRRADALRVGDRVVTSFSVNCDSCKRDLRGERIISVSDAGEEEVYDLTVEGTHNFIANGFVVHNTRWHYDDVYARILRYCQRRDPEHPEGWHIIHRKAIEDGKPIFPTRFTLPILNEIRSVQGDYLYSCFYDNEPVGEGFNPYDIRKFQFIDYVRPEQGKTPEERVQAPISHLFVDPAATDESYSCYSALVLADTLWNHKVVIRGAWIEKIDPDILIDRIFRMVEEYGIYRVGIEDEVFQRSLVFWIRREQLQRKTAFQCIPVKIPRNVHRLAKLSAIQPFIHNGEIVFDNKMEGRQDLMEEFATFPKGSHDDIVSAMSMIPHASLFPSKRLSPDAPPEKPHLVEFLDRICDRVRKNRNGRFSRLRVRSR